MTVATLHSFRFLLLATLCGCAHHIAMQNAHVSVWARSHNRRTVDVYLTCGDHDARLLGTIPPKEQAELSFPEAQIRCVAGLNFFLVVREYRRGYWVGPLYPRPGTSILLVIERYAGQSNAFISRE
jgi:hypothetical protein